MKPKKWLVTGAAGFIGFHLIDHLLKAGETVLAVDNFITGKRSRLDYLAKTNSAKDLKNFEFVEGDLQDLNLCRRLCKDSNLVLHQAALGSVPRSIVDPLLTHQHNVNVFLNMALAAKDSGIERFVYASSSSVYGDSPTMPKKEEHAGHALSPYAVTKQIDELYAQVFQRNYGLQTVGLRYFNVFGPAQDPNGVYAPVIPQWIRAMLAGAPATIFGDGTNSRDFCFVSNVVEANLLAARAPSEKSGRVYNIACGERTTLNELHELLQEACQKHRAGVQAQKPAYKPARDGDIPHSLASIELAERELKFKPKVRVGEGIEQTVAWYAKNNFLFE